MASSGTVKGLEIGANSSMNCEDCALNKCHAASHPTRKTGKATKPGNVLHIDTAGPAKPPGVGETQFMIVCKDEYSGFRQVKCVITKAQIADETKLMITTAEPETGNNVLKLTTDQGSEFLNRKLGAFLNQCGVIHQLSAKYTPQQNGTAEREIRTLVEAARTLNAASLPQTLWPEAVYSACYVLNRGCASNKIITPYELWHGTKPNVKNLRIFGQHAAVLKNKSGSKFEKRKN